MTTGLCSQTTLILFWVSRLSEVWDKQLASYGQAIVSLHVSSTQCVSLRFSLRDTMAFLIGTASKCRRGAKSIAQCIRIFAQGARWAHSRRPQQISARNAAMRVNRHSRESQIFHHAGSKFSYAECTSGTRNIVIAETQRAPQALQCIDQTAEQAVT